jgi:hypothetical protein
MKKFFSLLILFPFVSLGQSIFSNSITAVNPDESNPYTNGQIVNPDISVSGIGRGAGLYGINANNRYDARSWSLLPVLDPNAYFEFTITPNPGKKVDFVSFVYAGQVSLFGPTSFAFRSSVDGFIASIGTVTATGSTVSLSGAAFQNITTAITFRIYGWGAVLGTGTFSINDFTFNGIVGCAIPPVVPDLMDVTTTCTSTSFVVNWDACFNATEYSLDVATDAGFVTPVLGYSNKPLGDVTTHNVTGLLAGKTYYARLRAKNECGYSDYSNTVQVSPPSTTYSGGLWSNGTPSSSKTTIFSSNYTIATDMEACSCKIDSGVLVGVNSGVVLKLQNELDVTGTLTFENNASLVQVNDVAVNTGTIVYKRNTTPMKNFDYTYWSSPVVGQTLVALSPNTLSDKYFSYVNNSWKIETGSTPMDFGKGYIIRVPKPNFWPNPMTATYIQSVQFEGIPNNGTKSLAIGLTNGDGNLIGNPYPSAMSAGKFLAANNKELDGTIYFWSHNTAVSNLVYSSTDYASYNGVGGVGTTAPAPSGSSGGANNNTPDGNIAAGQSFFTVTKRGTGFTGSVTFNNGMRVEDTNKNAQFFKEVKSKKDAIVKHRVWLNLANDKGAFKQTLVGYVTGATLGNDAAFDGESFDGNKYIDFYSINDNKNLVIQGRALPFDKTDKVLLGYKTTVEGTFAISIDKVDGVLENQTVFIEDKVANVIHNLKKGAYSFSTLKGVFDDRFVLRYTDNSVVVVDPIVIDPVVVDPIVVIDPIVAVPIVAVPVITVPILTNPVVVDPVVLDPFLGGGTTLGTDGFENKGRAVVISVKDHQIKINSFDETIAKIMVYDFRGRLLCQNEPVNKSEYVIQNFNSSDQFLIVLTQLINGKWVSQEIFF